MKLQPAFPALKLAGREGTSAALTGAENLESKSVRHEQRREQFRVASQQIQPVIYKVIFQWNLFLHHRRQVQAASRLMLGRFFCNAIQWSY